MLKMNDIIREGNETLRQIALDVELPINDEDKKTLNLMMEYLKNSQNEEVCERYGLRPGVGLAAPQINVSKKMIAIYVDDDVKTYEYALINPKIISHSEEMIYLSGGEGCLSVDYEVDGYVPRYARVTVEGYNIDGEKITIRARGFIAIVFQHEIDHLNGILFLDKLTKDVNNMKAL